MDIIFKCPNCEQELEVDDSGAGSEIECPNCSSPLTVPASLSGGETAAPLQPPPVGAPPSPPKPVKQFVVPVHDHAPDALIQKPNARPLDVVAKEGDKTLRLKTIKRSDCKEVGKDHFDEVVSEFLEKVGQANIVSISPISYSTEGTGHQILTDYGVMIIFKG